MCVSVSVWVNICLGECVCVSVCACVHVRVCVVCVYECAEARGLVEEEDTPGVHSKGKCCTL